MDWAAWGGIVAASVMAGVAILWIVGGYYHLRYYRARAGEPETWKCQPARFLRPGQQQQAMALATLNLSIGGVISGTLVYFLTRGWKTPIYYQVAEGGWLYTIATTILLFILMDGLAYYAHRALHHKLVFR